MAHGPASHLLLVLLPPPAGAVGDATATPGAIALTVAVPAATATGAVNGTATPAVIARTVTLPASTTSAGTSATTAPAAIACTTTLPAPTASGVVNGTATPAAITASVAVPVPTVTTGNVPVYIQGQSAAIATSRSPSVTFSSGVQTGDVVYFYCSTTTATMTMTVPAPTGWENVLGTGNRVLSGVNCCIGVYHIVTSGENGQTTFTSTNLFNVAQVGNVLAAVIRNVDLTTPVDNAGSTFGASAVTPHILATITGTGSALDSNSLVISGVSKDLTGTYTDPAGYTMRQTSNSTSATWLGTRDALTTANTDVTATDITPSASDEYCSISVAFAAAAAVSPDATATPAVIACSVALPAPTTSGAGNVAPTVIARTVAVPLVSASGASTGTATPAVIARVVTLPAPIPQAGWTVTPAVIARSVIIGQATGQASITVAPTVIARSVVIGAVTTSGGAGGVAAPAVIARATIIPAPTPLAGSKALPAQIVLSVTLPVPVAGLVAAGIALPAAITLTLVMPHPHATGAGVYALYVGAAPVTAAYLGGTLINGNDIHLDDAVGLFAAASLFAVPELLLAVTNWYYGTETVEAVYLGDTLITDVHVGAS